MSQYVVFADATADLPPEMARECAICYLPMELEIGGQTLSFCADWDEDASHAFYDRLRGGEHATTTQITPFTYERAFAPVLEAGKDILYVCFSSGLSNTVGSAHLAAQTLKERFPERSLEIVDSLAATCGEGMAALYAARNRDKGMSLRENADWLRGNIRHFVHWFTVDDLMFLKRGGRITAATAMLGTALKLKPVMHVDAQGRLTPVDRVQGRKNSLKALAQKMSAACLPQALDHVFIGHGDCPRDAAFLAERIREAMPVGQIHILPICPIVGAHSGPGTVALFFFGTDR